MEATPNLGRCHQVFMSALLAVGWLAMNETCSLDRSILNGRNSLGVGIWVLPSAMRIEKNFAGFSLSDTCSGGEFRGLVARHQVSMLVVTGHFSAANQHTSRGIYIFIRARHQSILCSQILSLSVGPQRPHSLESWVPKHFPIRSSYKVRPLRLQTSHGIRPKPVVIVCGPWAHGRLRELFTSLHARTRAASSHWGLSDSLAGFSGRPIEKFLRRTSPHVRYRRRVHCASK
jgi:hypothetical protein